MFSDGGASAIERAHDVLNGLPLKVIEKKAGQPVHKALATDVLAFYQMYEAQKRAAAVLREALSTIKDMRHGEDVELARYKAREALRAEDRGPDLQGDELDVHHVEYARNEDGSHMTPAQSDEGWAVQ